VFGPIGLRADADPIDQMGPVNVQRVRAWAAEIAVQLRVPSEVATTGEESTTAASVSGSRPARRDAQLPVAS
jgi:hypothetical protein